jgi:hypothetical protein
MRWKGEDMRSGERERNRVAGIRIERERTRCDWQRKGMDKRRVE